MINGRALVSGIVLLAVINSVNCRAPVARRSLQGVLKISQCFQDPGGWPRFCFPTHAGLIAKTQNKTTRPANYAARARAFLVAGKAYCSQFNASDSTSCAWPCENNGMECAIAGALQYTVWDCPESKARAFYTCAQPPHLTASWCGLLPSCTFNSNPAQGLRKCEASFYLNMSPTEKRDFGPAYFVRIAREYTGCCLASNYRWRKQNSCTAANDVESACGKIPGCFFYPDLLKCSPSQEQLIQYMFDQDPQDPVATELIAMAKECTAITNATLCNNHKPVEVDNDKLLVYLNQDLDSFNMPVNDAQCLPQPSLSSDLTRRLRRGLLGPVD